jgi:hypothetical protein
MKKKPPLKKKRKVETESETESDSIHSDASIPDFLKTDKNVSKDCLVVDDDSDLDDLIPLPVSIRTPNSKSKPTTPNTSKNTTPKSKVKTSSKTTPKDVSKKAKPELIKIVQQMFSQVEKLIHETNTKNSAITKNMFNYSEESLKKNKKPELLELIKKLQAEKDKLSNKDTTISKTKPAHFRLEFFGRAFTVINESGIRKLDGRTIPEFLNGMTHKDKNAVRTEISKALYNYFWNKHEKANWRRSHYLDDIDYDGCKWRAYTILMKIEGSFDPFEKNKNPYGRMFNSESEDEE